MECACPERKDKERINECKVIFKLNKQTNTFWAVKRKYQEVRLVMVLLDESQTLSNELSFHFLTSNHNVHPWLQVKNAAIFLHEWEKVGWFDSVQIHLKTSERHTIVFLTRRLWKHSGMFVSAPMSLKASEISVGILMSYRSVSKSNSVVLVDVLLGKKREIQMWTISVNGGCIKSSCLYVHSSDRRRFQIMIRVPVFPNWVELMASTSRSSSACVLNGEYCRMSCRLALCSSLTHSKMEVKDEPLWPASLFISLEYVSFKSAISDVRNSTNGYYFKY